MAGPLALASVLLWLWRAVLVALAAWALVATARRRRWGWFVVSLVFAGAVAAGIFVKESKTPEKAAIERLEPKAERYAAIQGRPAKGSAHVRPGVVPIDVDDRKVDEGVYMDLSNQLQARSPGEVSTVVQIHYDEEVVGEYQDGQDAVQRFAKLTIVDVASGKRYRGGRVNGPEPSTVISRISGDPKGDPPSASKIAHRIEDLWTARLKKAQRQGH